MLFRRALLLAGAAALFTVGAAFAQDDTFDLTILHTNDEHGHHEPDSSGNGGQARWATVIDQVRANVENVILVDGGDRFTGTLFHQQHRGQDNALIMTMLGYTGMTLGNHEFDDGDDVLAAFIDSVNFPVMSANVTIPEDNPLASRVAPSAIVDVNGTLVGLIGLTTADTPTISSPGEGIEFSDDYAGIVNGIVEAMAAEGVNKVVLLTHLGLGLDIELAASLVGVDVIVGGHSHTLMGNAYTAAAGVEYPAEATSATGEPVLVVQAGGGNGLYGGRLDVSFDAAGLLTDWSGDTIFLSQYISPDPEVEALIATLAEPIEALRATPVGETTVFLVGDRAVCRVAECTLGNLITDAMRAETGAQIAITNGGGIRSNVPIESTPEDVALDTPYTVTLGDVLTVLPFGNLTSSFELSGADIVAAIEHGVGAVENGNGRFPQVSGLRYTFDPAQAAGSRVVSVEVQGEDGSFSPIDEATIYTVVSNDFTRRGGDGYTMFAENAVNPYDFGRPLDQVLADYIAANSPITPVIEGRITVVGS